MKALKSYEIEKPSFTSEVQLKRRPEMKVVCLSGRGDPMKTFDDKLTQVYDWLDNKGVELEEKPSLGIYYKNRAEVGVENVEWDACVPVEEEVQAEDNFRFVILPERRVASVVLTGDYDLIGPALKYLEQMADINGVEIEWPLTEIYRQEGKDAVTELQYFVKEDEEFGLQILQT